DTVRLLGITAPYLATVDHPLVAVAHGGGLELGGVAAHVRLSDGKRQLHLTAGDFGQITLFHRLTPIFNNWHGGKHRKVNGRSTGRPSAGRGNLSEHDAGFRDPEAAATVGGRNDRAQPAGSSKRVEELMRIGAGPVELAPVTPGKLSCQMPHFRP